MNSSTTLRAALGGVLWAVSACALAALVATPADAQRRGGKQRGIPLDRDARKAVNHPSIPKPPLSLAWEDPEAVSRGAATAERLVEAAGGWEAFEALEGIRYDLLQISRMNTGKGADPWKVHHYEARLVHFNTDGNGYLYSEYAKPSLTGPDFVREVMFEQLAWREMRGNFGRSLKARRTARSSMRLEFLTGAMPFSLKAMDARLAYIRTDETEFGPREIHAVQLEEPLTINYYPFMVEEYGDLDEFHLVIDPSIPRVVQMRFAFPDESVNRPPHLRWWTMDFEGTKEVSRESTPESAEGETGGEADGGAVLLPHRRFRWLDGFNDIDEMIGEDHIVERVPPAALRRPWLTSALYQMPYRCDFWDPPTGVDGLTGHDTGIPLAGPGEYPPGHPRYDPTRPAPMPDPPATEGQGGGEDAGEPEADG